jgi:hypothetical protein
MAKNLIPPSGAPSMVLQIKADQKQRIRVFDDNPCEMVWRHVYKDGKAYIKVPCTKKSPEGCPFCAINHAPENIDLVNSERPYPVGTDWVKLVYAYEPVNAVKFLVGTEIWKGIQNINSEKGEILDRDLMVRREDSGRTTYYVSDKDPSPFAVTLDPKTFPTMDQYMAWLESNRERVPLAKTAGDKAATASAGTEAAGEVASGKPSLIPSKEANAREAAPKVKHSPAMAAKLNATFQRLTFNHQALAQAMKKVNSEKVKVNDFEDGEVERLIVEYELAMQSQG